MTDPKHHTRPPRPGDRAKLKVCHLDQDGQQAILESANGSLGGVVRHQPNGTTTVALVNMLDPHGPGTGLTFAGKNSKTFTQTKIPGGEAGVVASPQDKGTADTIRATITRSCPSV